MGLGRDLGTHMKPENPFLGIAIVIALLSFKFRSAPMLYLSMGMVMADGVIGIMIKKTGATAKFIVLGAGAIGVWFIMKGAYNGGDYQLLGQFANWLNNFLGHP